jgi:hypothetical protein
MARLHLALPFGFSGGNFVINPISHARAACTADLVSRSARSSRSKGNERCGQVDGRGTEQMSTSGGAEERVHLKSREAERRGRGGRAEESCSRSD